LGIVVEYESSSLRFKILTNFPPPTTKGLLHAQSPSRMAYDEALAGSEDWVAFKHGKQIEPPFPFD
jgi:hypothetical protein